MDDSKPAAVAELSDKSEATTAAVQELSDKSEATMELSNKAMEIARCFYCFETLVVDSSTEDGSGPHEYDEGVFCIASLPEYRG
jgi:hypothetical protein